MLKLRHLLIIPLLILLHSSAFAAKLRVITTYPYIASLVKQIGMDRVNVQSLANGQWDPHVIIPKPSYTSKLRRADLLVINGAQMEIGWLPPIMQQANNPKILQESAGFLDLSKQIKLIDVPRGVSRAEGDIHPDGNPHYYLDPYNIPPLYRAILKKLCELDSLNAEYYRANYAQFDKDWKGRLKYWDGQMAKLKGTKVVEYHKNYDYLLRRYKITLAATLEPLPGIPPTSKHIEEVEQVIRRTKAPLILHDVYNSDSAARYLSGRLGIRIVKLPHDVGAVREAEGIFTLFDEIVRRLTR